MDKAGELKFLEKVVEHLSGQTAAEPADDLFNKMGILKGYLDEYAQQVSRERDTQWMRHLLKWGDKPAKFCPVLPKNKSN